MKIAVVMPCPWMHFSPHLATSSELTVHDILTRLPSADSVVVYAQEVNNPYTDIPCRFFSRKIKNDDSLLAWRIAQQILKDDIDIVVVEQHLPTAVKINRYLPNIPILLHRHNNYDPPHRNKFRRWIQSRRFKSISGIAFVSTHSRDHFLSYWGKDISCQTFIIPNGLDLSGFHLRAFHERTPEILFVGRSVPEKGGLEFARALQKILSYYPDWRARLMMGDPDTDPDYRQELLSILVPFQYQVTVEFQRPWVEIIQAYERASIAVVPSICNEAFGRTALEAMAGGAALISSIRGGLDEVVGDAAVRLTDITQDTIAAALVDLIEHPEKRAALSARGIEQAQKFTIEAQVDAFLSACRAVMDQKVKEAEQKQLRASIDFYQFLKPARRFFGR